MNKYHFPNNPDFCFQKKITNLPQDSLELHDDFCITDTGDIACFGTHVFISLKNKLYTYESSPH